MIWIARSEQSADQFRPNSASSSSAAATATASKAPCGKVSNPTPCWTRPFFRTFWPSDASALTPCPALLDITHGVPSLDFEEWKWSACEGTFSRNGIPIIQNNNNTMCDLTIVNPKKDSFKIGMATNQGVTLEAKEAVYFKVGNGTVLNYVSSEFTASGDYSALTYSGQWNISLTQNSDLTWNVTVTLTGSPAVAKYSRTFTATGTQTGSHELTFIANNGGSEKVVVSQDNGSIVTSGKIVVTPNWSPDSQSIYLEA